MISGLTAKEYSFLYEKLILPLKKKNAQVYLFGSRATGTFKQFSDIDLIYKPSTAGELPLNLIHSLLSEIEESSFPYKIDLVNDAELASSYRVNVNREKIQL